MFTGIIQTVGKISQKQTNNTDARLYIQATQLDWNNVQLGDSIAVNGVCLTAVKLPGDGFWADVSKETLLHTTLGKLTIGSAVNLEEALTPQMHLGGHIVSGHVDGVGTIIRYYEEGRSIRLDIKAPMELAKYIAPKGSICVDGISLTVNTVLNSEFSLNIVPHTQKLTTLANLKINQQVNLEVDIIARYLERLLLGKPESINKTFLQRHGFS
ncbi:riboflavin synthase [Thiotrichales bacterium HSG1]|nr:riboflavin synthase [Thiotrichales bacterium HSG1]